MFKVLITLLSMLCFIYGMADMCHVINHLSPYSDVIAILLSALCWLVRSLLGDSESTEQATRN